MNDYILSVILGIIEGLTEFLPVSSTAHLRIAEALMQVDLGSGYWKMYSIVIQLGAILALPIYFWPRLAKFFSTFPVGEREDRTAANHPLSLVILAFVCTAIPAFLLTRLIGKHLENLTIMGWSLLIGGIVMWVVDAIYGNRPQKITHMEEMTAGQAVWIGLCQVLSAIFPGTSRSMVTIAAGQLAGMTRAAALEFSFFVSIPTMVAATGYELLKTLRPKHVPGAETIVPISVDAHGWVLLAIGFVISFIVAYAVVAWFMNWVRQRGFVPFAIYRILVGAAVLVWVWKG
jgi:undecaprenyl-diphosphatase